MCLARAHRRLLPRRSSPGILSLVGLVLLSGLFQPVQGQTPARLEIEPASLVLARGSSATFEVRVLGEDGSVLDVPVRVTGPRRALTIDGASVTGDQVGAFEIQVSTLVPGTSGRPLLEALPVVVDWPSVVSIGIEADAPLFEGTTLNHRARAFHADGTERPNPDLSWTSSDPDVASVDGFGHLEAKAVGTVILQASFDGVQGSIEHEVRPFTGVELVLEGGSDEVRTGDVQRFTATVLDAQGSPVPGVPIEWRHAYEPVPGVLGPAAPGQMEDGRIVADVPGEFTVIAGAGPLRATHTFEAVVRNPVRPLEIVGVGRQERVYSTDFWVFEGLDGRDYALVGAKQADGHGFVFDVTDPENIVKTDSIQVDARSVNDVKVSPDGRYASLTREGASNRRNGVVILDLADPAHPKIASEYTEGLTGGVHNAYPTNDYLFALSNGDKYVILDVTDIYNPRYVSEYDHPDSRVHDVWVHDGLAYSAEWETGLVVVDIGNGRWGGSIENPVFVTSYPVPTGGTHAAFPYVSESTGDFYIFIGDEILTREGMAWEGIGPDYRQKYDPETGRGGYPRASWGYIQVIDFNDPEDPKMVARYEVSEFGTHNIWVANDILYQAYYEGGMRLVDVSGELMGNLYTQGREVAVYKAFDPEGFVPNSPGAWSVMPHKGLVWFADINSGLWAMRLGEANP